MLDDWNGQLQMTDYLNYYFSFFFWHKLFHSIDWMRNINKFHRQNKNIEQIFSPFAFSTQHISQENATTRAERKKFRLKPRPFLYWYANFTVAFNEIFKVLIATVVKTIYNNLYFHSIIETIIIFCFRCIYRNWAIVFSFCQRKNFGSTCLSLR